MNGGLKREWKEKQDIYNLALIPNLMEADPCISFSILMNI